VGKLTAADAAARYSGPLQATFLRHHRQLAGSTEADVEGTNKGTFASLLCSLKDLRFLLAS